MERRSGRRRARGALLLVLLCCSSACAPEAGEDVGSSLVEGVRTDPDHRGLVVSYVGGACDRRARLVVDEAPGAVDARVEVRSSRGPCTAVGIARTVSARLEEPLGARTLRVGGREHVPFDGARLLVPTALPPGFEAGAELGRTPPGPGRGRTATTTTWVTTYRDPAPEGDVCTPGRGTFEVLMAPVGSDEPRGLTRVGTARVGSRTARVHRDDEPRGPHLWSYAWTSGRHTVVVTSSADCAGDRPLDRAELLGVATSLGPL